MVMHRARFCYEVLLIFFGLLTACTAQAAPTLVPTVPLVIPTIVPASATPTTAPASPTMLSPSSTSVPTFVPTAIPTIKTTPTRTPTLKPGTMRVQIFLVAIDDGGKAGKKIGCGDSVVAVDRFVPVTNAPLRAALTELFSLRDRNYGQSGLYNALYQSTLKVDSASVIDAKATISLSGKVTLGGACDNPRFEAQIKETALQFSTVKSVTVYINGIPIEQVLSEKGG